MGYLETILAKNFLEYASYVVKERAIPQLDDGLKPVQRRILHSLFDMDDGHFHKVANVVGHCMQYHPHGDASIYSALVALANKDLLIERQGNFGNPMTGDPPSAARYIECRLSPLAKEILHNPEITTFVNSYDGRRKEPVVFPAKIPLVLVLGTEGIAVGMATRILPHNLVEVLQAERQALLGEPFTLYPDLPTGGVIDVSRYDEGRGRVIVRAQLDTTDQKRILIREVPFGTTTESLIASIESAARRGKIKVGGIVDYTAESVEIEIKLPRGVYAKDVVKGLYAFTDCEVLLSVNMLVIEGASPKITTVAEVITHHAQRLVALLTEELTLEKRQLQEKYRARTLERIFIEEGVYKTIEGMATREKIYDALRKGLAPFFDKEEMILSEEQQEALLRIPIRRISLYDMNKARRELREIQERLAEIETHLARPTQYAIAFLDNLLNRVGGKIPRRSQIQSIERVRLSEAMGRELTLRYDGETGYLGYSFTEGKILLRISPYDRLFIMHKGGEYEIIEAPEKLFVGKGLLHCLLADEGTLGEMVFTLLYREEETGHPYLKRFKIQNRLQRKRYRAVPEGGRLVKTTLREAGWIHMRFQGTRHSHACCPIDRYLIKGAGAKGVRLRKRVLTSARFSKSGEE